MVGNVVTNRGGNVGTYNLINAEFNAWLEAQRGGERYHAAIGDTPYYLGTITKRFGKPNSAPAQHGTDGAFARASKGFMGETWDGFESPRHYQEWVSRWAENMIPLLYPGALVAFFGGSRTWHRVAVGLEDAGLEIIDTITWHYASGFPKSYNLQKGFDKRYGAQSAQGVRWRGHGTALKPATEPIILARVPRDRSYIGLAEQYSTGALWIDGARLATAENTQRFSNVSIGGQGIYKGGTHPGTHGGHDLGRYPANVVFTHADTCKPGSCAPGCPAGLLDEQSGNRPSGGFAESRADSNRLLFKGNGGQPKIHYYDNGGASRFFFSGKAATWERCAGLPERCIHPTMKPLQLTEWLARLLLPPPGIQRRLLVPFAGVASEMIGALLAGWDYIDGVELGAVYADLGLARLKWWSQFPDYRTAKKAYNHAKQGLQQMDNTGGGSMTDNQLSLF